MGFLTQAEADAAFAAGVVFTPAWKASASRVLRSARKPLTPITAVMASPPTITDGATGSAIRPGAQATKGVGIPGNAEDSRFASLLGGPFAGAPANSNRIQTFTSDPAAPGVRFWGHGGGIRFGTAAASVEVGFASGGAKWMAYVTDMTTGIRARVAANDITAATTNLRCIRLDFATAIPRIIEFCSIGANTITAINVPVGDTVWAAPADEAAVSIVWDSWGQGVLTDAATPLGINPIKLALPDFLGERLGVTSPLCIAQGGTGVLNNLSGRTTYGQKIAAGDIAVSRVGVQDLVFIPVSVNDALQNNAAYTDAALTAAYAQVIADVMVAQPNAVVIGAGPQWTGAVPSNQGRYDAAKAGFLAGAGSNARAQYIDNSPLGEDWYASGTLTSTFGTDNLHPTQMGAAYYGYRIADSLVRKITAMLA